MPRLATARSGFRVLLLRLVVLGIAAGFLLAACGGGDEEAPETMEEVAGGDQSDQEEAKGTEGATVNDLPAMLLTAEDLPADLAGFTLSEEKAIPNEVKANTGGDDEPVTLDDPNYGDNLANINGWGRLAGYRVMFTRDAAAEGEPDSIEFELNLSETDEGAHDFFVGWFASDPNQCLFVGDESDCDGIRLNIESATGEVETRRTVLISFRTGRIIGEVAVRATVSADEEEDPELDDTAQELARLLFDKIQEQL